MSMYPGEMSGGGKGFGHYFGAAATAAATVLFWPVVALVILLLATGCTKKNITALEEPECDGETYRAVYHPPGADSVIVYGRCGG